MKTRREFLRDSIATFGATMLVPATIANQLSQSTPKDEIQEVVPLVYVGTKEWKQCSFYEICERLTLMVAELERQCRGTFNPQRDGFNIQTPKVQDIFQVRSPFGMTIEEFISARWPHCVLNGATSSVTSFVWLDLPNGNQISVSLGSGDYWRAFENLPA